MKARGRWVVFLVGLLCVTCALAGERQSIPIQDRDVFEKQLIECAMEKFQNGCLLPLFRNHASPNLKDAENGAAQLDAVLQESAKRLGVYKVHIFKKTIKAGIYDDRVYMIEMGNGGLACFRIVFRNVLGKWYVGVYRLSSDEEAMMKLLDLPLPNGLL